MRPSELLTERARWWRWVLALLIAVGGLSWHGAGVVWPLPVAIDTPAGLAAAENLAVASDVAATGRFTDGFMSGAPDPAARPPGMLIAPLYPVFIAVIGELDGRIPALGACLSGHLDRDFAECPTETGLLYPVQMALAVAALLLLWRSIHIATASRLAGWIGLLFAAWGSGDYAATAHSITPMALVLPLFAALGLCLVETVRRHSLFCAIGAGVALGLLTLVSTSYLPLAFALAAAGYQRMASVQFRRAPMRWLGEQWMLAAAIAVLIAAPWAVRNVVADGVPQLVRGLDGDSFSRRVAYSTIAPSEWAAGWVQAVPRYGSDWTEALFAPEATKRYEAGFVPDEAAALAVQAAAGGLDNQTTYLVRWGVLPHLPGYLATIPLIAWRAFWSGGGDAALATVPFLAWLLVRAVRRRHLRALVLTLPPILSLLFEAMTTLDPSDGHLLMIAALACAVGTAGAALAALARRLAEGIVERARA